MRKRIADQGCDRRQWFAAQDEVDLVIQAALDGAGLAVAENRVTEDVPGSFLYYPTRKQQAVAFALLTALQMKA